MSEQHEPPFKRDNEMLAYFFLTVVLQENMKHQQLKAVLEKAQRLPAWSRRAELNFP